MPLRASALATRLLHHLADVLDIQACAMEGAVGGDCAQHFADGPNAALARGFRALDHQGRGAHAHDHAVTPAIERNGCFFHDVVGGGGSAGQEAGAEPTDQMVGSDVVGRDDDHAAAPPGADPVLRHRNRLRGARAGGVDLRVGTAGADELGKLRVSHRQHSEQKTPVEDVGLFLDGGAQFRDAAVDLLRQSGMTIAFGRASAQTLQHGLTARGGRGLRNSGDISSAKES